MKIKRSPGLPRGFFIDPESPTALILRPIGLLAGAVAQQAISTDRAWRLVGGPLVFGALEVFLCRHDVVEIVDVTVSKLEEWAADEGGETAARVMAQKNALSQPRPPFAGLALDRPRVMGVVNVTPDSFYDGGRLMTVDQAVNHGRALQEAGADILDIGGESTRPGSECVSEQEEIDRVAPVVEQLAAEGALVSVDTRRASVMRIACAAGARIINDVSALADPGSMAVVADTGAAVILMHMQGTPRNMQDNPAYDHAPFQIMKSLMSRVAACEAAGIGLGNIAIDPGIGFGKSVGHNLEIIEQLSLFHAAGTAVMVGASRKSFIGAVANEIKADDRLPGSLAAATMATSQGVQLFRVHDVAETRQAISIAYACLNSVSR